MVVENRLSFLRVAIIAALVSIANLGALVAQDDTKGSDLKTELGVRQRLVERKMSELETKLTVIAEKLREKEPERAKLLVAAYQQSKERLITKKMAQISSLLDTEKYQEADQLLDEVIQNLESLIRLLTQQKDQKASKKDQEKMLERWKQKIQERLQEQKSQTKDTEKIAEKDKTIKNLEAQIKKLENLIGKQTEVIENTDAKSNAGLRALDGVADEQFEIRKQTESLKKEISGSEEPESANDGKPSDGKPSDGKPSDGKPSDGKPSDGKPSDGKPSDGKPSDGKPSDGKPSDGKPSDGKPSDG
eukprot:COSAG01_NODE_5376_length_4298_cov_20.521315_3_plen_303_part_01